MRRNKNILVFLLALFALFSTNGIGNSIVTKQINNRQTQATVSILKNPGSNDNHNIITIEGILQTSIKVNESNSPTFQNFNNSKKSSISNSFLQSFLFSKLYYAYYCSCRANSFSISHFYIAYHRLVI